MMAFRSQYSGIQAAQWVPQAYNYQLQEYFMEQYDSDWNRGDVSLHVSV